MAFDPEQPRDEEGQWAGDGSDQTASQSDEEAKDLYRQLLNMTPEQRETFLAGLSDDQLTRLGRFASTGKATDGPIADIRNKVGGAMNGRGLAPAAAGLKSKGGSRKKAASSGSKSSGSGGSGGGGSKGAGSKGGDKKSGSRGGGAGKSSGGGGKSRGSAKRSATKPAEKAAPAKATTPPRPVAQSVTRGPVGGPAGLVDELPPPRRGGRRRRGRRSDPRPQPVTASSANRPRRRAPSVAWAIRGASPMTASAGCSNSSCLSADLSTTCSCECGGAGHGKYVKAGDGLLRGKDGARGGGGDRMPTADDHKAVQGADPGARDAAMRALSDDGMRAARTEALQRLTPGLGDSKAKKKDLAARRDGVEAAFRAENERRAGSGKPPDRGTAVGTDTPPTSRTVEGGRLEPRQYGDTWSNRVIPDGGGAPEQPAGVKDRNNSFPTREAAEAALPRIGADHDASRRKAREREQADSDREAQWAREDADRAQAATRATEAQVQAIVRELHHRRRSGDGGGFMTGPTNEAALRRMSRADASRYITSLREEY